MNRIQTNLKALFAIAVSFGLTFAPGALAEDSTHLRIMAANISSGNDQSYDPGHGIRIFKGLKPDLVLIQEFNYGNNNSADIREFVDSTFGNEFKYYREAGMQIPNGIISRFPIEESGTWQDQEVSNRGFAYAKLKLPSGKYLWAVSVHLLTRDASTRHDEADQLLSYIRSKVPRADYLVIGGDFNTNRTSESALLSLSAEADISKQPADQDGKIGTNRSRQKPYDWVLPDTDLAPLQVPVQIGANKFNDGLVFDSRVYRPLTDVSPVRREDSGASNMQHMAVVKDFEIPAN